MDRYYSVEAMDSTINLMTEQEAADWLEMKAQTLAYWRMKGKGPRYLKLPTGTIRYDFEDLKSWAERGGEAA